MKTYMLNVAVLRFVTVFLLLMGVNKLCFGSFSLVRCIIGSFVGGIYAGVCMLPRFHFLGNTFWYIVVLLVISSVCFGWKKNALRPVALFLLFEALLGILISERADLWRVILCAVSVLILCYVGFRGDCLIPVQLNHNGNSISIMALRDTGNTLTDPITGHPVLVVGAQVASELTGLTKEQLERPVESIGLMPGLRLIPYRTIGQPGSMMLGLRMQDIRIGSWKGSALVAFAPEYLGRQGTYQALAGGSL